MLKRKTLIIGIDGGTWDILTPAMERGYMPYLKSLAGAGASGVLESTMPAITPAAWGTFQTGVNPGANGVFSFSFWDRKAKRTRYVSSRFLRRTLWEIASDAGKRVAVINVPMTYPPKHVNGCVIAGILSPSLDSDFTWPIELKQELLRDVPDYHIFSLKNRLKQMRDEGMKSFVDEMAEVLENRVKAAEIVMRRGPFDIFMVHFQASDLIQHGLWNYLDQSCEGFDEADRDYIFEKFYGKLDDKIRCVRELFEADSDDEILTLIVSDHGFQRHDKRVNLGNWLYEEGFFELNELPQKPGLIKQLTKKMGIGKLLKRFLPEHAVDGFEYSLGVSVSPIAWEKSRAVAIGRSAEGFIYILSVDNDERERVASEITDKLSELRDSETGEKVVAAIYRKEDIYHGAGMDVMPDLIVEPCGKYTFTGDYTPDEDLFYKVLQEDDFHLGRHHADGIMVASGQCVDPQEGLRAGLVDMTPTILYYMGLPIDSEMDGRVVDELFKAEFRGSSVIKPTAATDRNSDEGYSDEGYSDEEEKQIEERLRDMGYL